MTDQERALAVGILRGIALGADVGGTIGAGNPIAAGVTKGISISMNLLAGLVEKIGTEKTNEVLQRLVDHPAEPISAAQLAADVERVKREFIPSTLPPPNPYDSKDKP